MSLGTIRDIVQVDPSRGQRCGRARFLRSGCDQMGVAPGLERGTGSQLISREVEEDWSLSTEELDKILWTLPLWRFMDIQVEALAVHYYDNPEATRFEDIITT